MKVVQEQYANIHLTLSASFYVGRGRNDNMVGFRGAVNGALLVWMIVGEKETDGGRRTKYVNSYG